jgi:hypothetical protein
VLDELSNPELVERRSEQNQQEEERIFDVDLNRGDNHSDSNSDVIIV